MPTSCAADGKPELLNQQPVGTGPFQFVDYQQDAVIRYKANPDYLGASRRSTIWSSPSPPDATVACRSCKAGECDIMPYPNPADVAGAQGRPEPAR